MFGDDNSERLFYSRRIGRAPQLSPLDSKRFVDTDGFYEDTPQYTTILGAAKITGKTAGGVSIGVLEAVTDKEEATVEIPGGERLGVAVEPMTNYLVARAQKDFNDGRSTLGGIVTNVTRDLEGRGFRRPHEDRGHGRASISRTAGTTTSTSSTGACSGAISREARRPSPPRRPPRRDTFRGRTRITSNTIRREPPSADTGPSSTAGGRAGTAWNYMLAFRSRSPGFEVNDLGYMNVADDILGVAWVGYRYREPKGIVKRSQHQREPLQLLQLRRRQVGSGGNVNGSVLLHEQLVDLSRRRAHTGVSRHQPHAGRPAYARARRIQFVVRHEHGRSQASHGRTRRRIQPQRRGIRGILRRTLLRCQAIRPVRGAALLAVQLRQQRSAVCRTRSTITTSSRISTWTS